MTDYIDCRSTDLMDHRYCINIHWSILGSLPDVAGNKNPAHGHTHYKDGCVASDEFGKV